MWQGVNYIITTDSYESACEIVELINNSDFDDYRIVSCQAWIESQDEEYDEYEVEIYAQVPDRWGEGRAEDAMEELLDDNDLDYDDVDACLE